ncbi:unnamed protein product [Schistocephalus solidus]|uniref:Uncharacterized protein n=1 Tax=Schistocephalus solidus TaxID=70667 RepID=A0A183THK7_SCHSO|nr:unnamed protein product [Schistocephalus solidus]
MAGADADIHYPSYTPAGTTQVLAPSSRVLQTNQRAAFTDWLQVTNDALGSSGFNSGHNHNSNWPASCSLVKGTPIGSPISGLIAKVVLQRLESLVFQQHRPKFWAWCVDDTFVVIEWDPLLTLKERPNSVFLDINFTMEEEETNQLAFLDVLICRKG